MDHFEKSTGNKVETKEICMIGMSVMHSPWHHNVNSFVLYLYCLHNLFHNTFTYLPSTLPGDRLLTDVVFANRFGMVSVLVAPLNHYRDHPVAVVLR